MTSRDAMGAGRSYPAQPPPEVLEALPPMDPPDRRPLWRRRISSGGADCLVSQRSDEQPDDDGRGAWVRVPDADDPMRRGL